MNENVPSLEEIVASWEWKCRDVRCEACKLKDDSSRHPCHARYIHAVLAGEMTLEDSFRKELKPELPAWCKVGAWVTADDPSRSLGVIKDVPEHRDGSIFVMWKKHPDVSGSIDQPERFKPVRFREYTFEEAKGLLGKVMEYTTTFSEESSVPVAMIVMRVKNENGRVHYSTSGVSFEFLKSCNATIDGIPVGVPEIDEEALKGGQE